jgi:hypothetical protein
VAASEKRSELGCVARIQPARDLNSSAFGREFPSPPPSRPRNLVRRRTHDTFCSVNKVSFASTRAAALLISD